MLKGAIQRKIGITPRATFSSVIVVVNTFVWYFYAASTLEQIITGVTTDYNTIMLLWSIHFIGIIISAFIGSFKTSRMKERTTFISFWMVIGAIASFAPIVLNTADVLMVSVISGLWGACLGIGMANCMAYYSNSTTVDKRGSYGGIAMLCSALGIFLLGVANVETVILRLTVLSIWRCSGLAIFLLVKPLNPNYEENKEKRPTSYRNIISQRSFILYLVPWIMFSLLAYLSTPLKYDILGRQQVNFLETVENGLLSLFAIFGGFLADKVGRKRVTIIGFVVLGLGYAALGMFPNEMGSWYFHTLADGMAWGFFFVIFVITVWGDLSYELPSDKYYAAGATPFFISKFLQLTAEGSIVATIQPSSIFSFTAFFLFLAILPLMYAPETLPEKHIKERELKSYIEKAQKEATKAQKKEAESVQRENGDAEVETEGGDFEEILKEAEKYY